MSNERNLSNLIEAKSKKQLELTPLPYKKTDLEPVLSKDTLDYHYDKLAKGYVERYNSGQGDPKFNEAGAFLHNILFEQFHQPKGSNEPSGLISAIIKRKYGTFDKFKKEFADEAMKIQGSGWIYLSKSGTIKTIPNHEIRKDIFLLIDWWEHAWALDYQSDKAKYLDRIWQIIDWQVINNRL
jgi:Fe-Mn family superoxide dismutase